MAVGTGKSETGMRIGIDASNIRAGGGVTHLVELLQAAEPLLHGFEQVVVWAGANTLQRIEDRTWLQKMYDPLLDRPLPVRMYWQQFVLDRLVRQTGCDMLFTPGGVYSGSVHPYVTMSQNLLPFQWGEAQRYGPSWMLLKMIALRHMQSQSMRQADGVIFLTEYGRDVVMESLSVLEGSTTVIPHGINKRFECPPRSPRSIESCSTRTPFRILYVSIVTVYKHQWHVAEAVAKLRRKGLPVSLDLVGPAYPPALRRLQKTLREVDPNQEFIRYRGAISYAELSQEYQHADAFVFASTCETFGQIVTEAMSAGLPIACSDTGTMRELLAEHAVYFNPEQPAEIARVLEMMILNTEARTHLAWGAYDRAKAYTWERCASQTFEFIAQVARQ